MLDEPYATNQSYEVNTFDKVNEVAKSDEAADEDDTDEIDDWAESYETAESFEPVAESDFATEKDTESDNKALDKSQAEALTENQGQHQDAKDISLDKPQDTSDTQAASQDKSQDIQNTIGEVEYQGKSLDMSQESQAEVADAHELAQVIKPIQPVQPTQAITAEQANLSDSNFASDSKLVISSLDDVTNQDKHPEDMLQPVETAKTLDEGQSAIQSEPEFQSEANDEAKAETKVGSETEGDSETEFDAKKEVKSEAQVSTEDEAKAENKDKAKAEIKGKAETEVTAEPEGKANAEDKAETLDKSYGVFLDDSKDALQNETVPHEGNKFKSELSALMSQKGMGYRQQWNPIHKPASKAQASESNLSPVDASSKVEPITENQAAQLTSAAEMSEDKASHASVINVPNVFEESNKANEAHETNVTSHVLAADGTTQTYEPESGHEYKVESEIKYEAKSESQPKAKSESRIESIHESKLESGLKPDSQPESKSEVNSKTVVKNAINQPNEDENSFEVKANTEKVKADELNANAEAKVNAEAGDEPEAEAGTEIDTTEADTGVHGTAEVEAAPSTQAESSAGDLARAGVDVLSKENEVVSNSAHLPEQGVIDLARPGRLDQPLSDLGKKARNFLNSIHSKIQKSNYLEPKNQSSSQDRDLPQSAKPVDMGASALASKQADKQSGNAPHTSNKPFTPNANHKANTSNVPHAAHATYTASEFNQAAAEKAEVIADAPAGKQVADSAQGKAQTTFQDEGKDELNSSPKSLAEAKAKAESEAVADLASMFEDLSDETGNVSAIRPEPAVDLQDLAWALSDDSCDEQYDKLAANDGGVPVGLEESSPQNSKRTVATDDAMGRRDDKAAFGRTADIQSHQALNDALEHFPDDTKAPSSANDNLASAQSQAHLQTQAQIQSKADSPAQVESKARAESQAQIESTALAPVQVQSKLQDEALELDKTPNKEFGQSKLESAAKSQLASTKARPEMDAIPKTQALNQDQIRGKQPTRANQAQDTPAAKDNLGAPRAPMANDAHEPVVSAQNLSQEHLSPHKQPMSKAKEDAKVSKIAQGKAVKANNSSPADKGASKAHHESIAKAQTKGDINTKAETQAKDNVPAKSESANKAPAKAQAKVESSAKAETIANAETPANAKDESSVKVDTPAQGDVQSPKKKAPSKARAQGQAQDKVQANNAPQPQLDAKSKAVDKGEKGKKSANAKPRLDGKRAHSAQALARKQTKPQDDLANKSENNVQPANEVVTDFESEAKVKADTKGQAKANNQANTKAQVKVDAQTKADAKDQANAKAQVKVDAQTKADAKDQANAKAQVNAHANAQTEAKIDYERAQASGIEQLQAQRPQVDIGNAQDKSYKESQRQLVKDSESDSMLHDDPLADLKRAAARAKDEKSRRHGTYAQSDSYLNQADQPAFYSQEPDEQLAALKKAVATAKAEAAAEAQSKQVHNPDDPLTALKQALSDPKGTSLESRKAMQAAFDAKREEQKARDEQSQDDPFAALKNVLSESKEDFDKSQNVSGADDPLSSLKQAMTSLGSPLGKADPNALNNANDGAAKINLHTTAAHNLTHTYGAYAKQFKREQQSAQRGQTQALTQEAQPQIQSVLARDNAQANGQMSTKGANAFVANAQDDIASAVGAAIKDELAKLNNEEYLDGGFGDLNEKSSLEDQAQSDTPLSDEEYESTKKQVLTKLMQSSRYEGLTPSFKQEIASKVMSQAPTQRAMQPAMKNRLSETATRRVDAGAISSATNGGQAANSGQVANSQFGQTQATKANKFTQDHQAPRGQSSLSTGGQAATDTPTRNVRGGFSVEEMAAAIDENTRKRAAFKAQQERLSQQKSAPAPLPYGENRQPLSGAESAEDELSFDDLVDERFRATIDRVKRTYHFPEEVAQGFEQFKNQGNRYKIFHHINANFAKHINATKFGGEQEPQKASQFIMDKDGRIRRATPAEREKELQAQNHALWTAPNIKR